MTILSGKVVFILKWHPELGALLMFQQHFDGLVPNCSNSIANALELLQCYSSNVNPQCAGTELTWFN